MEERTVATATGAGRQTDDSLQSKMAAVISSGGGGREGGEGGEGGGGENSEGKSIYYTVHHVVTSPCRSAVLDISLKHFLWIYDFSYFMAHNMFSLVKLFVLQFKPFTCRLFSLSSAFPLSFSEYGMSC